MSGLIWNYSFTVPCALLMATLLAFYFSMRRLPIRINQSFLALLALQLLVMIFDVGSSLADERFQQFSPELLYLLNTLFFVFYLCRIACFFGFTLELLHIKNKLLIALAFLPFAIGEVLCISSFATGAVFWIQDGYHSGPFYNVLYVCAYFYIILSVILLAVYAKRLSKREFASAIAFNVVLLVGNVVRYLFPFLLAMNTFCMVAIVVIYLAFMNPDRFLSDDRSIFNLLAFQTILRDWAGRKDYQVLGFVLRNYNYERSVIGGQQTDNFIAAISEYLSHTFPDMLPFYLRKGRFALMSRPSADWKADQRTITERFQQPWHIEGASMTFSIAFAHATSQAVSGNAAELSDNFTIALEESSNLPESETDASGDGHEIISITDQRVEALRSLENAIRDESVEVFLQPIFDSNTEEVIAAEALARIRNTEQGIVSPELFIPLAERSGYIGPLGDQVLEKVCAFIRDHDIKQMGLGWINVNLSPVQCLQHDLIDHVMERVDYHGVDPALIHFEITEESMVDYIMLEKQIMTLRLNGFQFALDDYGSGYSNLTRVKHYPFVNVKIDREVIWDYCKERDNLLPALVKSFRQMGLSVTAEGIETADMAFCATNIGCDCLQGFLYSKPLPMDEFVQKFGGNA